MALSKLDKKFLKFKKKSTKKVPTSRSDKLREKYGEIKEKKVSKLFKRKKKKAETVNKKETATILKKKASPEAHLPEKHKKKDFFSLFRKKTKPQTEDDSQQKGGQSLFKKKVKPETEKPVSVAPKKVTNPPEIKGNIPTKHKKEKHKIAKTEEKEETVKETDIRKLFKKRAKEKKKVITAAERKRRLDDYLEKSGMETKQRGVSKKIFYFAIISALLITIIWIFLARYGSVIGTIIQVLIIWTLGFIFIWGSAWIFFRIYLDLLMFKRKLSMEEVLPDFLQLTSANLRAGMPIDRALWFAVRPRFGVLANEIEDVAKRTLAGEDLNDALLNFARKYDSQVLLRSVYLLIEGMEAGGDIAELLNKIALNIQEMRSMRKEMSANVTTYVIFISFAAMIAAPALFALSSQLLDIVQNIAAEVTSSGDTTSGVGLSINMNPDSIKMSDYQIFAYLCLSLSSVFSAIIVATIRKGNIKEGLQYIPIFLIVSLSIYFIVSKLLGVFMGEMF